jgi:hypothetical protein
VEILCKENGKLRPAETIPAMGREGMADNEVGSEFKYDIL